MKKIISLLMVLCIMASLCTVSACADGVCEHNPFKVTGITVTDRAAHPLEGGREGFTVNHRSKCADISDNNYLAKDASSYYVELYSGSTLLATAYPKNSNDPATSDSNLTVDTDTGYLHHEGNGTYPDNPGANFVIWGEESGSWKIVWSNLPTEELLPNKATLYADGHSVSESFSNITTEAVKDLYAVTAAIAVRDGNGNRFYDKLDEAVAAAADGATIEIRDAGTYTLPVDVTKNLTIKAVVVSKDQVVVKSDVPVDNKANLNLDGVTVVAPEFVLQDAVDASSNGAAITLPAQVVVSEPVKVPANTAIEIKLQDTTFDNDLVAASGVGSIFTLGEGASVTITNVVGTPAELNAMRALVSKDYCVRKGSIIIDDAHNLGSDGKCKDCAVQVVSNTYAVPSTADNSNMPLWTILFVGFAVVALLTGKKKKA